MNDTDNSDNNDTNSNNNNNNTNKPTSNTNRQKNGNGYKRSAQNRSSTSSASSSSSNSDTEPAAKRARKTDEQAEKREQELDDLLSPEYRKFRPRGYRFNEPPKDRPIRVYADGVFDLFHLGHMRQLEQAKKALPNATLVVGVPSDKDTHKYKGLTVLTDKQRCETLEHCKWVDEVICDAPWQVTLEFLEKHDIDYVAHDDLPYASNGDDDIYRPVKELGKFLTTQRTEGISTSDIITHIIRDYDKYLMRNFARGASRKDLNVSWLKKNELDLKRHVLQFRESFKSKGSSSNSSSSQHSGPRDMYSELMGFVSSALHLKNSNNSSSNESSFFDNVKDWVGRRIDTSHPPSDDSD